MALENNIAYFIKYNREKAGMTQEQLAKRAGVGLRFIRDLEQGKESLRIDKVNQVLSLFGHKMVPKNERIIDPYEILMKYMNDNIHIYLKNRKELYGFLMEPVIENQEINAWKFVSNNNAKEYKEKEKKKEEDLGKLIQTINHADIEKIEIYETGR